MTPEYSIVIPAFDEEDFLGASLAAARAAMAAVPMPGEIVVADNNSRDRTAEIAREAGARVVFEPVNQIGRARNAGAAAAAGRHLLFLDADTFLPSATLGAALAALESGRVCGGGARILFDAPLPWAGRAFAAAWNGLAPLFRLAAGSFLFCRRDAFELAGGFPLGVYAGEEVLLSRRLAKVGRRAGMEFLVLREPVVTSARKVQWHSTARLAAVALLIMACPPLARSRRVCAVWYERPGRPLPGGKWGRPP